jgi:hypothetical protein
MADVGPWRGAPSRAREAVGGAISSAPLTFAYAAVLLGTTVAFRLVPAATASRWLHASSTDVAHLGADPVTVLVLSALSLPGRLWLPYAVVLLVVVRPLERRIGSATTALVFASGHVLATLLTELPIAAAIGVGWLAPAAAHRLDVGASYGTLALVAAFAGALSPVRALVVLGLAVLLVGGTSVTAPGMSTYGHALSMAIGVCWWPRLYHRRTTWRVRRPPKPRPSDLESRPRPSGGGTTSGTRFPSPVSPRRPWRSRSRSSRRSQQ